jgi:alanyl-tRNA synthetase
LDKEREARRDAERRVAQMRDRVTELEDAGKSELERATSQLKRAADELAKSNARVSELEGELQRRDLDTLKAQIAAEHDLPASVAKRLQGKDARELKADAKALKEELQAGTPVGSLGIGRGGTASGGRRVDMNSLIREAAGR